MNDSKSGVRKAATNTLAKYDDPKVIDIAKQFLEYDDWRIRRSVVDLLIKIGTDASLEPLISCLNDEDSYVKSWAAKGLGKLKSIKDIDPLLRMLKDEDPKLRLSAAKALGEIGDKKALEPLIASMGEDNWEVRKEIENALNSIDSKWADSL